MMGGPAATGKLRISVGLHNLSGSHTAVRRAGIQNVVFETARQVLAYRGDVELTPIFRFPVTNFADTPFFMPTHFNASDLVLRETLAELGTSPAEVMARWPYLATLFQEPYDERAYEAACLEAIAGTELFFEPSLCDLRNVIDGARRLNPKLRCGLLVHDLIPLIYPELVVEGIDHWSRYQYVESLRYADFTIAVSRNTAIDLSRWLPLHAKPGSGPYYVPLPSPRHPRQTPAAPYIAAVATLEPRKNLEALVRAYQRFRAWFPETPLRLVLAGGKGWKNEVFQELVAGRPEGISMTGYISNEELTALFQGAMCLALPSHYEGFGLPLAHAREHGVPIISALNSSLPEAAGLEAAFVRPWAVDDLACAIGAIYHRQKEAEPSGRPLMATIGGWDDLLGKWLDVFQRVRDATAAAAAALSPPLRFYRRPAGLIGIDVSFPSLLKPLAKAAAPGVWVADKLSPEQGTSLPWVRWQGELRAGPAREQHVVSGGGQAFRFAMMLKSSLVFLVGAVARLEAMPGLSEALHLGLRLVAVVEGRHLPSQVPGTSSHKLALYVEGLARWADAVVADPAAARTLTRLKPELAGRIHVDASLIARVKAGDLTVIKSLADLAMAPPSSRDLRAAAGAPREALR
jgi:glycosyltransferase involved in cell wall biosynthesis